MKKLVLIDGHSILNRAFYGLPDLTNVHGLHTNAIYGFLNILFKKPSPYPLFVLSFIIYYSMGVAALYGILTGIEALKGKKNKEQ